MRLHAGAGGGRGRSSRSGHRGEADRGGVEVEHRPLLRAQGHDGGAEDLDLLLEGLRLDAEVGDLVVGEALGLVAAGLLLELAGQDAAQDLVLLAGRIGRRAELGRLLVGLVELRQGGLQLLLEVVRVGAEGLVLRLQRRELALHRLELVAQRRDRGIGTAGLKVFHLLLGVVQLGLERVVLREEAGHPFLEVRALHTGEGAFGGVEALAQRGGLAQGVGELLLRVGQLRLQRGDPLLHRGGIGGDCLGSRGGRGRGGGTARAPRRRPGREEGPGRRSGRGRRPVWRGRHRSCRPGRSACPGRT